MFSVPGWWVEAGNKKPAIQNTTLYIRGLCLEIKLTKARHDPRHVSAGACDFMFFARKRGAAPLHCIHGYAGPSHEEACTRKFSPIPEKQWSELECTIRFSFQPISS
jgi:hypothetical protein